MVFYFTGTGNSLYAAKCLDTKAISIPRILNSERLVFTADKIGIVCPIYGHELPAMVKEFIRKGEFYTDYFYVILTYGNRHANAVELAENLLTLNGITPAYISTLLMVDNFLPAFDMTEQIALDKKVNEQLAQIKADIDLKQRKIQSVSSQDRAVHEFYLERMKNQPETVWSAFVITDECVGCGICTKVCPAACIYLEEQRAIHKADNCQACYACIHACPKMAIQMAIPEKNPHARYRNENVSLGEIVAANNQTEN